MLGICISVGSAALWVGLVGLVLDLGGASLIVAVDISRFDFLWQDDKRAEKAGTLREVRKELFQQGVLRDEDDGFDCVKNVILNESESDLDPIKIRAKPPGTLGGGGNVFIYEGEGTNEPHEGIGSHNLVDGWIQRKIEELESGLRDQWRRIGMAILGIGFLFQIVSYLIRNFQLVSNFLIESVPC